jgi:hypothetical protein
MPVTTYTKDTRQSTKLEGGWYVETRSERISPLYLQRFTKFERDGLSLYFAHAPVSTPIPGPNVQAISAERLIQDIGASPAEEWHVWAIKDAGLSSFGEARTVKVAVYGEDLTKRPPAQAIGLLESTLMARILEARDAGADYFLAPEHYFARNHSLQQIQSLAVTEEEKGHVVRWLGQASAAAPAMLIVAGTIAWSRQDKDKTIRVSNTALVAYHGSVTGYDKMGMHTASDQVTVSLVGQDAKGDPGDVPQLDLEINDLLTRVQICADAGGCGPGLRYWDLQLITAFDLGAINPHVHEQGYCFVSDGKQGISKMKGDQSRPEVQGAFGLKVFDITIRPLRVKPETRAQPFARPVP